MNTRPTAAERAHLARVKALDCSVCGAAGPSDAHHITQSSAWTCVALCKDCHTSPILGWHGQKRAWVVRKMGQIDALAVTIRKLSE